MVLIALSVFLFCVINQHSGHDWGDDFALYLRQATGIVDGRVGDVLADNRFTVDNSSWSTFSPYSYPWGFPLLLAPFVAWRGLDYDFLKIIEAAFFAGFLFVFAQILRRRVNEITTATLVLLIGLSVPYVGWTDTVLSEFPYLFALAMALWWLDRCRERSLLEGSFGPLIVLGVLIGYTYTVRREGMALFLALVAVHLVLIGQRMWAARRSDPLHALRAVQWTRVATPYAAALAWIGGLQIVLPTVIYQSFPNTGLSQVKPNIIWYRDILAEQIGLKDAGYPELQLLGSAGLARFALGLFVGLSIIGIGARAIRATALDASLIGYLVGVSAIFAITPFHEGRYLFSITPLMAYFAFHGASQIVELLAPEGPGGRRAARRRRHGVRARLHARQRARPLATHRAPPRPGRPSDLGPCRSERDPDVRCGTRHHRRGRRHRLLPRPRHEPLQRPALAAGHVARPRARADGLLRDGDELDVFAGPHQRRGSGRRRAREGVGERVLHHLGHARRGGAVTRWSG